jgi:hypothetical protein
MYNEGGFRCFDLRIAVRRYFMSLPEQLFFYLGQFTPIHYFPIINSLVTFQSSILSYRENVVLLCYRAKCMRRRISDSTSRKGTNMQSAFAFWETVGGSCAPARVNKSNS